MTTTVRLIIHEEPMGNPMWNNFVIHAPRIYEIIVLPFAHFIVRYIYHHICPLPTLRDPGTNSGVTISAMLNLYLPRPSPTQWMELCEGGLERAGWEEVPKDERFWIH
jgi:hypothetical protein